MKKKTLIVLLSFIAVMLILTLISEFPLVENIELPGSSSGIRCILITDLHSCYYGKDQKDLVKMVDKEAPDIVFLSGDIFDDRKKDDNAKEFLEQIAGRYICFYVTGNHEYWSGRVEDMCSYVESTGITVLRGDLSSITVKGRKIDVCGVDDPTFMTDEEWFGELDDAFSKTSEDSYKILLSHRPEKIEVYERYDFDLILSGHAHAGQFRIPFVNRGVYAPNQGLFPKYINGFYELKNGTGLIVSRGLARESTPLPRFFNNPEIIVFEL